MIASETLEAYEILEQLEKIGTTRNPKVELLKKHKQNTRLGSIFFYAYNWQHTWGISVPEVHQTGAHVDDWTVFAELLDSLIARKITGNEARTVVQKYLESQSPLAQKWLIRVMEKDLQIRVSTGTIEKIWPGVIPTFDIQLADTYEEGVTQLQYPLIVEPKLDGLRILIFCKDGKGVALSRGAKSYESLQFIADEIAKAVKGIAMADEEFVVDGEVYAKSGWNETVSLVKTHPDNMTDDQKSRLKSNLIYYVFDARTLRTVYTERRKFVERLVNLTALPNVKWIVGEKVSNVEEMNEAYDFFLRQGFEGMMIKKPDAWPQLGRSDAWLKYKPEVEMDVEIMSLHEGQSPNTIGKLGQVKVRTKEGVEFFVGSGFTFVDREEMWKFRDAMIGRIIEIKTQKDAGQNVAKARFPIFKRVRDDRNRYEFSMQEHSVTLTPKPLDVSSKPDLLAHESVRAIENDMWREILKDEDKKDD